MDHDPINDKTIIKTNKYKIELSKNEINIWIKVTLLKTQENEFREDNYEIKISDITLIDSYFNPLKGNIYLIYNYLIRFLKKNIYSVEKDKNDPEKIIIKIECLKENIKEFIQIKLESLDKLNKEEANNKMNVEGENESESKNMILDCLAAPIIGVDKNYSNSCDNDTFFYYKNIEKNNEYNIFIYKNEIKDNNYKEIIFKIIDIGKPNNNVYYAYLNLVDFFRMSENYFSQFNYSIDEIYDDILIIFSNHNYKLEESKNCLRIIIAYINSYGNYKGFIAKASINAFKIGIDNRNIDDMLKTYYPQLIKYIKKFGDDYKDKKFINLIKEPEKYIKEKSSKAQEKRKNEIKNMINHLLEQFEKQNNIIKNFNMINKNQNNNNSKQYNKDINVNNYNIIITNKEIFDLYIKESKLLKKNDNEKQNINEKVDVEYKKNEKDNKVGNVIKHNNNIPDEKIQKDTINIIIDKMDINDIFKRDDNNNTTKKIENEVNDVKNENNINKEKIINGNENIIPLNEETEKEKDINNIMKKEKEKVSNTIEKEEGEEKDKIENEIIEKKICKNNYINTISSKQKDESQEKNLNDTNPFFLNKKRKRVLLMNSNQNINLVKSTNLFINLILSKRKRLSNNPTLLKDSQLLFLLRKIEKFCPEFRYLNLQIHTDIIFNYDIKQNLNSNKENDSHIINEFYEKSKNRKNLIFIIKTKDNKTFGGFSELGFNQNNITNNISSNSFIFSIDKMKIYDFIENNGDCIFGYMNKLPEFKNQILFEDNNLKFGYTGNKNCGFLIEEDYELNDGQKIFYIDRIQVISLNNLNL